MEVKCSWCMKKFAGTTDFLNHFFARHQCPKPKKNILHLKSAVQSSCEICGKQIITTSNQNMRKHIESHFGVMPFYCDLCYFPTVSENSLRLHKQNRHKQSPRVEILDLHQCDICNSFFKTLSDLMRHYVKHLKKMQFSCGICKLMFREEIDLVVHSHLHGETNHCFICGETCSTRPALLTHVLTHRKSRFFRNFRTRMENGQLLSLFPQQYSSLPKVNTLNCGESLSGSELETAAVAEIRTDLKLRTSGVVGCQGAPESKTSGAIGSQIAPESRTSGAIGSQGVPESRTSGAIESQGAPESRTLGAIGSQGVPESRTLGAIGSQGVPESRTLGAFESRNINEPRTSDAIGTLRIPRLRTSDPIESRSINESRTLIVWHPVAIGSLRTNRSRTSDCIESWSLGASDVHGNKNNSRLRTVVTSENNLKPRNSVLVKKENDQPTISNAMDSSKLKTCIGSLNDPNLRTSDIIESRSTADVVESRGNIKLRTLDDVKNGNECIINYNYTLAERSRDRREEPEFEVLKKTIKKEPDIEYQQDIDYLCDVVMEEKQFDLEHFISNFSKDTRSNDRISERNMQPNSMASNIYFCNLVEIEKDTETTSIKECNTHAKGIQGTNSQTISLQENCNLVSPLSLTVTLPDLQSKTFDSSCGFGSSTSYKTHPKSKANGCLKKNYISTEEPEVQQNLLDSNSLETDVPTIRNNRITFKNKKSKEQSTFNLNCNMVGTSRQKDNIPNTINTINAEISSSTIEHSQPRFKMDVSKTLPTCIQSGKRSWPQFGRNNVRKVAYDHIKSQKLHVGPKSQFKAVICKPSTNCSGSRQVHTRSKLQLKSGLDKSISNSLEPQMPSLRSRSRLLNELHETAKNRSEPQQVHTRTRSQLRKDLCEVYPKSAESQDLNLKTLSVSLHKLPSYVMGMRSYRKYCRTQRIEMLRRRRQGRSNQYMGRTSLQEKTGVDSDEEIPCPPSFLQSDLISEKDFPIDNSRNSSSLFRSSRSQNAMLSTRKQSCEADTKKDSSVIIDTYSACEKPALKEKHSYSTKTFFSKKSSSYKSTKKKSKFCGNRWSRSRYKTTKALDKIKSVLFSRLQKTSLKENYFDCDDDQLNRNGSGSQSDSVASSSTLSNIGHFCEIPTDENISITRAIQANSTCKTVLSKDILSSSSENCPDFLKSHPKRKGNATPKMSSKYKHAKVSNNLIRFSPRLSSLSSHLGFTDNEHSVNTHTKDGFNIKLKSGLRNSKKTLQKDNPTDNTCCIVERLSCRPVSKNSNGELIKYNMHAFKKNSCEQISTKHQTSEVFTPTLTILDISVQLERLPDSVYDMPSYKEFCMNKKMDEVKMLGMEDQSGLNISESAYSESQAKWKSLLKQKIAISQNQNEKKASKMNINKSCSFQAVERTSSSVLNSMPRKSKANAQKCVNDFINENAIDEFYDSEETETASSNAEFLSSDDSSLDSSNQFSNKLKFLKSQRQLLSRFTSSVKNYELDTSKNSEACGSSQPKSSDILPSSNIRQRSFNRTANEAATSSDISSPIPFKYWAMNGPSIAKRYSSTIIKSKPIQPKTIKSVLHYEKVKASPLGSLDIHKKTKKSVRKLTHKMRKARIRKRSNHAISGSKSSGESTIKLDEPKQIKNILYGMNKEIYRLHCRTKNEARHSHKRPESPEKSIIRRKVNDSIQRHTLPFKRSLQHEPKNNSGFFSRPIQLDVKLRRLPEYIYEKYTKGKPIMISSLLPIVENVRNIHWELKMTHQITIEHSYSEQYVKPVPLTRIEHSYSSWSANV